VIKIRLPSISWFHPFQFVLRRGVEIVGAVPLAKLSRQLTARLGDHAPTPYRWSREKHVSPALNVHVVLHGPELGRTVLPAF
jgi:hypothetical protein